MSRRGWVALVVVFAVCAVMAVAILQSRRHQQAIDHARGRIAALQWPAQFDDSKPVAGCEQTSHRVCFRVVGETPADAAAAAARVFGVDPAQVRQIGTPPVFV